MMLDPFSMREQEIFRTLHALADCPFVVIGGYAVNAYTLPRFSVDCDIVVQNKRDVASIHRVLIALGYVKRALHDDIPYAGNFVRYEKTLDRGFVVSIDILIDVVIDRLTHAKFTASWVFAHASKKVLRGKTINEELQVNIIALDALLVMKIIACRSTDIRDVFMMAPYVTDNAWVREEVASRYDPQDRFQVLMKKIEAQQFKDGLAGVYGQIDKKTFEKHKNAVRALSKV